MCKQLLEINRYSTTRALLLNEVCTCILQTFIFALLVNDVNPVLIYCKYLFQKKMFTLHSQKVKKIAIEALTEVEKLAVTENTALNDQLYVYMYKM